MIRFEHLVGIPFEWGRRDCVALVQTVYAENFGIKIRNYSRPTNWDADKLDLLRKLYSSEGFEAIDRWRLNDLRPGDVLAMALRSANPNHLAIYVGGNQILHHRLARLSEVEPLRDAYIHGTSFVLRHPEVPDIREVYPTVTIEELLRDRYAPAVDGELPG